MKKRVAIINRRHFTNLQKFLMELGKGYTFVARQQPTPGIGGNVREKIDVKAGGISVQKI